MLLTIGRAKMGSVIDEVVKKGKCMGCGSCYLSCPKNLITYKENNEGFIVAEILKSNACSNCGLCLKKCPAKKESESPPKNTHIYYGYAGDTKIRANATSGGICSAFAEDFLKCNEMVVCAKFDFETGDIKHSEINCDCWTNSMKTFYCQSNQIDSFSQIKESLKNDRRVLFVGTPCQVHGLKQYLGGGKNTEKLLTIDFLCHGVPSRKLFRQYYNKISKKEIEDYNFRSKCNGWPKHMLAIQLKNGKVIKCKATLDKYQFLFQEDLSLNSACFFCPFRAQHSADITVGDFWMWEKENLKPSEIEMGLSIVIPNTIKGENAVESAVNVGNLVLHETKSTYRDTVLHEVQFNFNKYKRREEFFHYYTMKGYEKTIFRYATILNAIKLKVKYILKKLGAKQI